jgi:hypothetical protein
VKRWAAAFRGMLKNNLTVSIRNFVYLIIVVSSAFVPYIHNRLEDLTLRSSECFEM